MSRRLLSISLCSLRLRVCCISLRSFSDLCSLKLTVKSEPSFQVCLYESPKTQDANKIHQAPERQMIFHGTRMSKSSVSGTMKAKVVDSLAIFTWTSTHAQESMAMQPTSLCNLASSYPMAPVDTRPQHSSATFPSQLKLNPHC